MEKLITRFINAQKEFIHSKGAEKSVENLYDIIYSLHESSERNGEENYILAESYHLVGENIYAAKIIESALLNAKGKDEQRLKSLQKKVDLQLKGWNTKQYRDLRDSRSVKKPTKLKIEDFIIEKDRDNSYRIKISPDIKTIVILNKHLKNGDGFGDCYLFSHTAPDELLLLTLIDYIEWLGRIKQELLVFYNNSYITGKIDNAGQEWFDGLHVSDFLVSVDIEGNFKTQITLYDYLQNDFGFELEIENNTITDIEYDPHL